MASTPINQSESRASTILAGTIVPTVISSFFVIARIYSRRCLSGRWSLDDSLIAIAWVISLGLAVILCLPVVYGAGHHQQFLSDANLIATKKLAFANRIVYQFVLCTTKLGICSFYLRIFEDKQSKRILYALSAFILVAALTVDFIIVFSYRPVSGAWTLGARNCLPARPIYIGSTVINIIGDVALMGFVVPKIFILEIPGRQKVCACSVVCLGFLVIIASILRLLSIIRFNDSDDLSWQVGSITTWVSIEVSTALLCASAPCLKPLITKFFPHLLSSLISTTAEPRDRPESIETKRVRSRRQSMQSQKSAFIPHLKKAITTRVKTGLEEVKLKTINAKRLSRGTFAYAVRKRDDAFQENDWQDLTKGASVESWLGRIEDEEAVKKAAVTVALSDGSRDFGSIGRSTSGVPSIMSSG
ncbi:hypothetical protein WAI453_002567 [Rhynchosporium graminicola]